MPNISFDPQLTSYFYDNSTNDSVVEHGVFSDNSVNNGTVLGVASFVDNSQNNGVVHGDAYVGTTATVPASSVLGTVYDAGTPLHGYTACNPNNGKALTLYIHHDDILTHGTLLYKYPNFFEAFSGDFYMSQIKYTVDSVSGITDIESCDPYAN
jgi:hypothetical protein